MAKSCIFKSDDEHESEEDWVKADGSEPVQKREVVNLRTMFRREVIHFSIFSTSFEWDVSTYLCKFKPCVIQGNECCEFQSVPIVE